MTDPSDRKQKVSALNSAQLVANACLNKGQIKKTKMITKDDQMPKEFSEQSDAKAKDS